MKINKKILPLTIQLTPQMSEKLEYIAHANNTDPETLAFLYLQGGINGAWDFKINKPRRRRRR